MSSFFAISEDVTAGEVALIAMTGEIDYSVSPQLRERIFDHIDAGRRRVVLDLSDATFIDSTAIGVLVGASARLRGLGDADPLAFAGHRGAGSLAIVCPEDNEHVEQILRITGVDAAVALYRDRDAALAAPTPSR